MPCPYHRSRIDTQFSEIQHFLINHQQQKMRNSVARHVVSLQLAYEHPRKDNKGAGWSGTEPSSMAVSPSETTTFDDVALANRAKQGDTGAFTDLVERYAPRVFRVARHITRNDQDAEDVLQETFLKAYSGLDQFLGHSKFYTWVVRIAVNEALMRMRRGKDRAMVSLDQEFETTDGWLLREVPSGDETPEEIFGRVELSNYIAGAIDGLSETYRPVFVLRDVEGFSTEETGQMLELSESAVKSRLLRARLQLRQKLRRVLGRNGHETKTYV